MDNTYIRSAEKPNEIAIALTRGGTFPLRNWDSSRLTHADYDEETMMAFIAFPGTKNKPEGSVYEYLDVEPDVWDGFEAAESKGSYAIAHLIGKRGSPAPYKYREVLPANPQGGMHTAASAPNASPRSAGDVVDAPTRSATAAERSPSDTIAELPTKDEELLQRALAFKAAAASLTKLQGLVYLIETPDNYAAAGNRLVALKAERKLVLERVNLVYQPAYDAMLAARKFRDDAIAPYDDAEKLLKQGMLGYQELELKARRKAEQEARQKAEREAREQAEQQAREDAERDARYAEAQQEPELAASIRANPLPVAPQPVAPIVMQSAVPQVDGVSGRPKWKYRILDETKIPLSHEFYTLDPKKLQSRANNLKEHGTIPGALECYDERTISVRS